MKENDLTGKRAALYIRVSTDEQARHGLSLDEQEHELKAYAIEHGAVIVGIYRDEGTTARKNLKRRKELQRLLSDVKANEIDVILFIKLDRWFRNIADYYKVQEILDAHGVDWVAIRESYNTTSSNGRLMLNIRLSVAQNESDQTADRVNFIFEGKKRRKEVLGVLPLGYKTNKNKRIEIDKETAPIIQDMFNHFLLSQSAHETMLYMQKKHNIKITYQGIRKMLKNKSYIGTFYSIEGYAPPIVDRATFDRVQTVMQSRRVESPRKPIEPYLFTGLIHCPSCNWILSGHSFSSYSKQKNKIKRYKYYICNKHLQQGQCNFNANVPEIEIENYLLDNMEHLIYEYKTGFKPSPMAKKNDKRVSELKEALSRLKDLYVNGYIERDEYENDFKKYNQELQIALGKAETTHKKPPIALLSIIEKGIPAIYEKLSAGARKKFWHAIIKNIYIVSYQKTWSKENRFTIVFL